MSEEKMAPPAGFGRPCVECKWFDDTRPTNPGPYANIVVIPVCLHERATQESRRVYDPVNGWPDPFAYQRRCSEMRSVGGCGPMGRLFEATNPA